MSDVLRKMLELGVDLFHSCISGKKDLVARGIIQELDHCVAAWINE